ncbi:Transcriptional regulator, IclR family [[Actinomadura] parvosata subsp. kistnae]|uniref:IclR family transcriptional regulator n=1 Tax=[Actinomadura] parvosata subsp. kistnae TaxID=1909395 RepID=A0A1V0A523_9ACTN|nr:IclR family transcriptional regulator [Nonomuraea sp. ATCC 55076]AQZ65304.1 IclR family transcriptional regulator [Nonomuraea sp. ATCC 55076]SPL96622.1 Transcriptional regulator, IclR family [Actinomadura parvosata subsp. kistnae]
MQNVINALRVLEEVADRQPVGVGELARGLGLPKSTVQRSLKTLHEAGWIRPAGGEVTRWQVTSKALQVARRTELGLRDAAVPVMEELRQRTGETIHLMVPEGDAVVLIERLETDKPLRIVLPLGTRLPLHASANGKAVLAHLDRPLGDLPGYTDTTITDPRALRAELDAVLARGYADNRGEWRSDIAAVAAAVLAPGPVASLSVSTPASRMTEELRAEYGKLVAGAARTLAELLN